MKKLGQKGTVLVTLLVFVSMAVVVIAAVTAVTIINTQSTAVLADGNYMYHIAEAGMENALVRVIRDPNNYTGETLTIDGNTVTISVTGATTKTIISQANSGKYIRKIQVTATAQDNLVTVLTWEEIP